MTSMHLYTYTETYINTTNRYVNDRPTFQTEKISSKILSILRHNNNNNNKNNKNKNNNNNNNNTNNVYLSDSYTYILWTNSERFNVHLRALLQEQYQQT